MFLQRTPSTLEVIKLTGDINVTRGEYSFVVPDLDLPGRICDETEYPGARAIPGSGQIAGFMFSNPEWIDVEG
jgi:Cyclin D1 binding domain